MNYDSPHRRLNILTREWVLVSPQRAKRPWQGQVEKVPPENLPAYDPHCYLCPGNARAEGKTNPLYTSTFVFDNDFPALLLPDQMISGQGDRVTKEVTLSPSNPVAPSPSHLFTAEPVTGICRVVCFSPRHDLTLPLMSQEEVETVIHTWVEQTVDLGSRDFINYVQIFENRTAMMGASSPHPHSQIWTTSIIPVELAKELAAQSDYWRGHGSCLLCDYVAAEKKSGERVVCANEHFTALVPFWAVWPFELLVIGHRHAGFLADLTDGEVAGLADILRRVTARYDNLFEVTFPYSMGFHQAPTDGPALNSSQTLNSSASHPEWHLHAHFYPPLLRSATVRKFMVGFEMLGMPQRDITPETAAERLRGLSEVHYRVH
jgi:UDPglucose--hexose-1-phosphate uridylyltransferase